MRTLLHTKRMHIMVGINHRQLYLATSIQISSTMEWCPLEELLFTIIHTTLEMPIKDNNPMPNTLIKHTSNNSLIQEEVVPPDITLKEVVAGEPAVPLNFSINDIPYNIYL